jgi:hypothetical protein
MDTTCIRTTPEVSFAPAEGLDMKLLANYFSAPFTTTLFNQQDILDTTLKHEQLKSNDIVQFNP